MSGGRQRGPDQLRGLLLTLVIFGHTYAAGISHDLSKWIIYGFHMPLFFAISGWLLSQSSLTRRSLPELLAYYWRRMIWQWLLVSVAFGFWKGALPSTLKGTIDLVFFEPLFHLWFIPALVIMVVVTHVILRAGCGWTTLAVVAAGSYVLFELPFGKDYIPESLSSLDHRYGSYFVWFMLGFAVRNTTWARLSAPILSAIGVVIAGVGAVIYLIAFSGGALQRDIGFTTLNTGLVLLLPAIISALNRSLPLIGEGLSRVGRGSLWIYLLHPFVTETWRPHDDGSWRGRLIGALITLGILTVYSGWSMLASYLRSRRAPAEAGELGEVPENAGIADPGESSIDPPLDPVPTIDVMQREHVSSAPGDDKLDVRRVPLTPADTSVLNVPDAAHPSR